MRYGRQVHICPRRTREVEAAYAAMSDHASWVASDSLGTGTVWKWSYTQIDSHGEPTRSTYAARPCIVAQCSAGSMPTRS
ncbi:hypothetical protein GCM10025870_23420 [Agromyces marinus]|uniref:Uncharacterized protein n=1 Tax=Agromyces marinus TaxID=1389020 RepID=A0ABM8H3A4_9MICO|nr:hypothetical protein GCM10025870_23420 [Agromyces marinus]